MPAAARVPLIDQARSLALVAMAVYHTTFDLTMFGVLAPGTATTGGWAIFARVIAGSFLALAGGSLWLAQGRGIRWRPFARRLAVIVAAAAAVTVATRIAVGEVFVYFGILHAIALFSLMGLAALRLHPALTALAALAFAAAPHFLRSAALDGGIWAWTGLAAHPRPAVDFVPPFPWFGAFLAGLAAAQAADRAGLLDRLRVAPGREGRLSRALGWPGRHSLAIYLIHQPMIIAVLAGALRLAR